MGFLYRELRHALSRRNILGFASASTFTFATEKILLQPIYEFISRPLSDREMLREIIGLDHLNLSVSCGPKTFQRIHRGSKWNTFHPDNFAGSLPLISVLKGVEKDNIETQADKVFDISDNENILVLGGPVGTLAARIAFEFEGDSNQQLNRCDDPIIDLRWYGLANYLDERVRKNPKLLYKMEYTGIREVNNWPLIDTVNGTTLEVKSGSFNKDFSAYWMENNYFTITRIPNFLSDIFDNLERASQIPFSVIVDGRNGIGTRAIELLLSDQGKLALKAAYDTRQKLGDCFQLLFKVSDMQTDIFSRFKSIELIAHHRIELKDEDIKRARKYAIRRKKELQST